MADDSIISYSDLIGDDGTFKELAKDIEKLEKQLIDLAKTTKKAFKSVNPNDAAQIEKLEKQVRELTQANKNLAKAKEVVRKSQKKQIELTKEELIQRESLKLEKREALRLAKAEAQILKAEKNTIQSLRAQLSKATIEWSKFTAEELKNTKAGKQALKSKKDLTAQLKKLEKATGDARRNVGNYTSALGKLGKTAQAVFLGRSIVDGIRRISSAVSGLVDKFRESNDAIGGIGTAFDRASGALQFAGVKALEFFAPAIEKIANLLFKLPAFFAGAGAAASEFAGFVGSVFSSLTLRLELVGAQLEKANPFSNKTAAEIEANIARINAAIDKNANRTFNLTKAYSDTYDAVLAEQEAFIKEQEAAEKAAADKKAKEIRDREREAARKQLELRIKAIEKINKELLRLQTENIEEAQERAIELEKLRFNEEKELKKQQLDELAEFFKDNEEKLLEIENLRRRLSEEQEEKHQQNILDIRKQYAIKTNDIEAIDVTKQREEETKVVIKGLDEINEKEKQNAKERSERLTKQKEETKELLTQIGETANKIGAEVVKLLDKQADLAKDNVNEQVNNLDRARERAAQGLESNIAFEEKELARRQAEQQKKEKQAQQAAKLLTLFNLVSAYAQSGDENALFRGLADFALLEQFSNGLQEFYEGTEDTGTASNPLDNKGGRLAILHDNERVVTKAQNMLLGGMSNDDLVQNALIGSQMSDNFNPISSTQINAFAKQKEDFVNSFKTEQRQDSNRELIKEVKGLRQQIANQPNMSYELEKLYEGLYGLVKTEQKANYKKIQRQKLKPRF